MNQHAHVENKTIRRIFRTLSRVPVEEGRAGEKQQSAFAELRAIVRALQKRVGELEAQQRAINGDTEKAAPQ